MKYFVSTFISLFLLLSTQAQELLVNVTVNAQGATNDQNVYQDLEDNIRNYFNTTAFTTDKYEGFERIRVNMAILIRQRPSSDRFICRATLQVYRPAYNSTYESISLFYRDDDFNFNYVPYQSLNYAENTYTDNLTAMLNFYAFLILGFDYASFGPLGGVPYFQQARDIVNLANGVATESGWKSSENNRKNRFWLTDALLNNTYRPFQQIIYKYHRQGIDQMVVNPVRGRKAILESLRELQRLNRLGARLYIVRMFLDAKNAELVKVFQEAPLNDKKEFVNIMADVDPTNQTKYNSVLEDQK
ncbi:MAG: DUF4835 family protein [Bacteroidota bacterium]